MIALYIASNMIFIFALKVKHISIKDVFVYIFYGFLNLYTLSIYISNITGVYTRYPISLLTDKGIIEKVLLTSSIAIITFAVCLLRSNVRIESDNYIEIRNINLFKWLYAFLFPIAFYLNTIDNWTQGTRTGILAQLSAYSRNILTVLCVVLFCSRKIKNWQKLVYLLLFMALTFRSTQRTNMMIVLIAFAYNMRSAKAVAGSLGGGIVALLSLGAIRNAQSALNFMYSILAEGLFGSWGLLQAIETIHTRGYSYTNLVKIFNTVFNWFFSQFGMIISLPTLEQTITQSGESYYPMGGFFYLSDAYLMHPFIGPAFYTILIFSLYRWSLRGYYNNHSPLYLLCLSILFVSIKGALWTFTALLLFHLLVYGALRWITNPQIKFTYHRYVRIHLKS